MYRPRKAKISMDDGSLDSLMDVLSCAVGVMLFIVIFAVIEARGTSVAVYAPPLLRDPPAGSNRLIALCQNGRVRLLDIGAALELLLKDSDQLAYAGVPDFVDRANRSNVADDFFRYRLLFREEKHGKYDRKRIVSVRVETKPGVIGEDKNELSSGSSVFEKTLTELGGQKHWLAFGIDADSLEIFKKARLIAIENGFSTGWDPVEIKFPYEEVVLGGGGKKQVVGKPRSGLGVVQ